MKLLAITLILSLQVVPARARETSVDCAVHVTKPAALVTKFHEIAADLRARGLNALTADLDAQKISLVFAKRRWPWQADVSARSTFATDTPTLTIRDLDLSTDETKQKSTWEVAQALYELQVFSGLWSARADRPADFNFSDLDQDDGFKAYLRDMPRAWRDQQLKRISALENELYRLFTSLNLLRAEDLMPKKDAGPLWALKPLLGFDSARGIGPNQESFAKWQGLAARPPPSRSARLLYSYYMTHVRRLLVATMFLQGVPYIVPSAEYIPTAIEMHFSHNKILDYERGRLERQIHFEESQPRPDRGLILTLRAQLKQLQASHK